MIDYHCFCQIKYLHEHQGLNASQIATEVSLDPRTVSYWLAQDRFRPRKPAPANSIRFVDSLRIIYAQIPVSPHH